MGILNKTHVKNYTQCLQKLIIRLLESEYFAECTELQNHLLDLILNTVPNNEVMHGLTTSLSLLHFNHSPSEEQMEEAYVIGWCLQMFATCYLIADDLFDESETRHYKPCWYLRRGKGSKALLDTILLENCVFYLLQQFFEKKPYYLKMISMFHEAKHKITYASVYEEILSLPSQMNYGFLNMKNYNLCVSYKMSFYPIYIHVMMAMFLNDVKDPEQDSDLKKIFAKIDFHFQVRDDYMDVYGDNSSHESETGTDIEKGRCTWNVCKALEICSSTQKTEILANYGKQSNEIARQIVKGVYDDIGLPKRFLTYELEAYHEVENSINAYTSKKENKYFPTELFQDMMWASFKNRIQPERHTKGRAKRYPESQTNDLAKLKIWASEFFNFLGHFPEFVSLCGVHKLGESIGDALYLNKLLYYNVLPGKKTRGILVAKTIKMCYTGTDSDQLIKNAQIVGWCIEMLQAAALIADDVMDQGTLRRGQGCWHRLPNVGRAALNDALFLTCLVSKILKDTSGQEPYFEKLESLFETIILQTTYGQQQDALLGMELNLFEFTSQIYERLVKFKTAYYTLVLPVLSSLIMMRVNDAETIKSVTEILLKLGYFYQVNDDYLDAFEDKSSRKTNNDIEQGKCTWFICKAMETSDKLGESVLVENYGKVGKVYVDKVIAQYKLLGLKEEFTNMRKRELENTISLIQKNENFQPCLKEFLEKLCNAVYSNVAKKGEDFKEGGHTVKRPKMDNIRFEKVM